MKRLVAVALVGILAYSPAAYAGDTLMESARRAAHAVVDAQAAEKARTAAYVPQAKRAVRGVVRPHLLQELPPGLDNSGMRKRTKFLIAAAALAGFVGVAYKIDHSVEDNTPSTLGQRQD